MNSTMNSKPPTFRLFSRVVLVSSMSGPCLFFSRGHGHERCVHEKPPF